MEETSCMIWAYRKKLKKKTSDRGYRKRSGGIERHDRDNRQGVQERGKRERNQRRDKEIERQQIREYRKKPVA